MLSYNELQKKDKIVLSESEIEDAAYEKHMYDGIFGEGGFVESEKKPVDDGVIKSFMHSPKSARMDFSKAIRDALAQEFRP